MRVVLVPGSPVATDAVRVALTGRYKVEELPDLAEALERCEEIEVGLVVLVWPTSSLGPDRLTRLLERRNRQCPMLAVLPPDRVQVRRALTRNAVRYVPEPVDKQELLSLAEQLESGRSRSRTWLGDLCIDTNLRQVTRAGARIRLTRREFDLLDHFQHNRGLVLTKEQLLDALWGSNVYNPNVVEVAVSGLRRKLERFGPRLIHTVHGVGYLCHTDVDDAPPLEGLMERRRSLLADRQRLLAERDAIVARARTLRTPTDDGG